MNKQYTAWGYKLPFSGSFHDLKAVGITEDEAISSINMGSVFVGDSEIWGKFYRLPDHDGHAVFVNEKISG